MPRYDSQPRVVAVLGPTNTGKTYLAIERMLGHGSGMIGFPLRLLARENYDRVVRLRGPGCAALVTGEEKIVPPHARYFLCTVESMPLDRPVSFLAIDEVQLAADPDRGHVFTDRLLRARGLDETMFLGAETIRPLIRRLVPEAQFVTRPRFSTLAYAGSKKITRVPPRSAVVAFSAGDVYTLAELMRRQRGGAAVVLGALSPRVRNAQVAMYQSGEVDCIIATDAIGMGLNMDIAHVAFARLVKFDGRSARTISASEMAQIAGRAGRHMSDGAFGTTTEVGPLDADTVEAVEEHRFPPLTGVFWRNAELGFSSPEALLKSLAEPPPARELIRAREADDHLALKALARDEEVARLATGPAAVRLLWEVCQIPDYRKIMSDAHARLLKQIYGHLMGLHGCLPEDWVAKSIAGLERTDGDIDTLATRIAHIRTWTFVAYRGDWLADPIHWQERSRAIEDSLSDALHERLTQRFVDRRTAVLVTRFKERAEPVAAVEPSGEVIVEGERVGRLEGFRFVLEAGPTREVPRALVNAAHRALRGEIDDRLDGCEKEADAAFTVGADGRLAWRGAPVARLAPGPSLLEPRIEPLSSELLEPSHRERLRRRLERWVESHIGARLAPLMRARQAGLTGPARGIVFQLCESLGSLARRACAAEVTVLGAGDRKALRRLGVRIGHDSVFMPALLQAAAVETRAVLWAAYRDLVPPPVRGCGAVSIPLDRGRPGSFYEAIGYRPFPDGRGGGRALRVDMAERLADEARKLGRQGAFIATPALTALAGCEGTELAAVLAGLGFSADEDETGLSFRPRRRTKKNGKRARPGKPRRSGPPADSPFAKLRELDLTS
jgi:ATP-dependent RNA helicase SUPV3L1/SUV3